MLKAIEQFICGLFGGHDTISDNEYCYGDYYCMNCGKELD